MSHASDVSIEGLILKGVGGFYSVYTPGDSLVCRPRGRFRKDGVRPLPGDRVRVSALPDGTGRIEEILPRRNVFSRPPVANIQTLAIVISQAIPKSDPFLIDRMAAQSAKLGVDVLICVNKTDIDPGGALLDLYANAGFRTLRLSAETGEGLPALRAALSDRVTAFAGNSGVGKSSLINRLMPHLELPTSLVSARGGRGRHTTRHVELLPFGEDTWVVDTPGFSQFHTDIIDAIPPREIGFLFPDIVRFEEECRFAECLHLGAGGCAVQQAVARGDIAESRFQSYKRLVLATQENRKHGKP